MAQINERIRQIRDEFSDSNNKLFAKRLHYSEQFASGLCNNDSVGNKVIERITDAFPMISKVWLLTGEGPMLKQEGGPNVFSNGDNNKIAGHDINECTKLEALYEARISDLQDRVSHQRAIIDSLTRTLEAMAGK